MSFCQNNLELVGKEKHEKKICPRCGVEFTCKRGDIANCDCIEVFLLPETQKFLQKTNYDCLCVNCLKEINQMVKKSLTDSFPRDFPECQLGLHFYYQNGYIVFTEYYHILRGYCCHSGCRHCAYGYGKVAKNSTVAKTPSRQVE